MKNISFSSTVPPMQFNITNRETNNSIHNHTMIRNGNNSTASMLGNKVQNNDCKNDIVAIKDMMIDEKHSNEKFKREMNLMMMTFMQELRTENEELKCMIRNLMNASMSSNGIASNVISTDQEEIDDDSFESIEMKKIIEITNTVFTPCIISSVSDKNNLLHNLL